MSLLGAPIDEPICSRAGCREPAAWTIAWRNPKIHGADRRKLWLACDSHLEFLRDFLASRDFPLDVTAGVIDDENRREA